LILNMKYTIAPIIKIGIAKPIRPNKIPAIFPM